MASKLNHYEIITDQSNRYPYSELVDLISVVLATTVQLGGCDRSAVRELASLVVDLERFKCKIRVTKLRYLHGQLASGRENECRGELLPATGIARLGPEHRVGTTLRINVLLHEIK